MPLQGVCLHRRMSSEYEIKYMNLKGRFMSKDIWELYEFWKALEGDLKELGKSDVVSQKLLAQFTKYLKDPREFIRGKVLGMLGERLRETKFKDKVLLNPLIECWDDEKYWIREVASDLIRQWGSQYFKPKEIFEELSKQGAERRRKRIRDAEMNLVIF